jgi:RNA polymerase sigma factor (sigma-70 family)
MVSFSAYSHALFSRRKGLFILRNFNNWRDAEEGVRLREERVIFIGKEAVPVTEEVYRTYYKMDRHARYLEEDVKVGRSIADPVTGEVSYKQSKEDSIERMFEKGMNLTDEHSVEDTACDNAMLLLLNKAKEILDEEELKLIDAVYDKELTYRQVGEMFNISHVAVQKRHNKVLDKLRRFFIELGYQSCLLIG